MEPTLRPDLDVLPSYVPGRSAPGAIKLASNEVSLPPPARVLSAITEAAADVNRYPDNGAVAITEKIAQRHGLRPEQIAIGCGSVSLCQQLTQITCAEPEDEVVFAWRSFEMYPIHTQIVGARARRVPLDQNFRHDLAAMADAVTPRTKLVFVCSPNNPTGTAVHRDELTELLAAAPRTLVVLDEAYREFVDDPDVPDGLSLLAEHPNLVVLRTFSKAYRLAGLRLGYAAATPRVASALRKVQLTFGVNAIAQAAASAALDCLPELLETCAEIMRERVRVRDELVAAGFTVPPSQANFLWLPLADRSTEFAEHCAEHKVIVRPFDGDGVRVTIAGADENEQFLAAARTFR